MPGDYMVIGKVTNKINGVIVYYMNAIEYVPNSMLVAWKG